MDRQIGGLIGGILAFVALVLIVLIFVLRSRKQRDIVRRLSQPGLASWTDTNSNISDVQVEAGTMEVHFSTSRERSNHPPPDPMQGRVISTMAYMLHEEPFRTETPSKELCNMPSGRLSKDYPNVK